MKTFTVSMASVSLTILLLGCSARQHQGSGGGGPMTINKSTTAFVSYTIWGTGENVKTMRDLNSRLTYVVYLDMTDFAESKSGGTGDGKNDFVRLKDGRNFTLTYSTRDRTLSIANQKFSLDNGAVFLCSMSKGPTTIEQLTVPFDTNIEKIPDEEVRRIASNNPAVRKFVESR